MTLCLNPDCGDPHNDDAALVCRSCSAKLLLNQRYRPLRPIGRGSFGRTFLAVDELQPSKPRCAVKQFLPDDRSRKSLAKATGLFRQEAIRLEDLGKHPQIPHLLAHFEEEGRLYLIQEFIDGPDLEQALEEGGAFSDKEVRQVLVELLPILQFVHDRHVIHRDIKPENIIRRRCDDRLVLVDFGASKLATGTALTTTGTSIGSAGYAAPEQAFGKAIFASDIYSLGVTCIHLLTNISPFDLFDSREGKWVWRDFLTHDRAVDPQLAKVLDKMLLQGTAHRYSTPAAALKELISPPEAPKPKTPPKPEAKKEKPIATVSPPGELQQLEEQRSKRVNTSYILWIVGFFLGTSVRPLKGLHRFYNGKILTGILWMIPVVGDIGHLIDLFFVPRIVDDWQEETKAKLGVSRSGVPLQTPAAVTETIATPTTEELQVQLLKAAQLRGGKLSVTQAVVDTGMGFAKAERMLNELAKSGYAATEGDPDTGAVLYRFTGL